MLQDKEIFSFPPMIVAQRVEQVPSFFAQGVVASVVAHALLFGGYSAFLACVALWPELFTPEWYPPQTGVFSRAHAASRAIVVQAVFMPRKQQQRMPAVAFSTQTSEQPHPDAVLEARETHITRFRNVKRPLRKPVELDNIKCVPLPSTAPRTGPASPHDLAADRPETNPEPPPARVPRRERPLAIETVTSVASVATRASQGAESQTPPRMVFNPSPVYPDAQNAAGIGGLVKIYVRLDKSGTVQIARIYQSSGVDALDQEALAAVRRWRFEPLSSDRPTARELIVRTRFVPGQRAVDAR